jgi:hypothetical protein
MWRWLVIASLTLLGACNVVLTKDPLFTHADEAGAPALRPGVWLIFREADCKFDETRPFVEWPDCAGGGLIAGGEIVNHKSGTPKDVLEKTPVVLAAGDPRIAQLPVEMTADVQASAEASGGAAASASSSGPATVRPYGYAAVRPTKLDEVGRIVAFKFWPVDCGPPPPKDKNGADTALGTLKPLPGIEMKPGEAVCTTRSKDALRAAAKASEAWADHPIAEARWLRDAER